MGLFSSIFSSAKPEGDNEQKVDLKQFDVLKYDGIRALRISKPAYALKCFTEALKIQQDIETMKYLVAVCNNLDMNDLALETLNNMIDLGEEPANSLLMRANFFFTNELYAETAIDCEQTIELEPDNYTAYFLLAKTEVALGERTKAISHLDKATGIKEDFAEGFALRADIYLALEKGNEALEDIEKVIELMPEDETAYLLRGRINELLGNAQAAFLDYQQALDRNPFNESAYLLAGQLMVSQGKYTEAIALYDEATEQIDSFAKAYAARAFAKHQIGEHESALADEETAKELDPEAIGSPDENPNFDNLYQGGIY